MERLLDGLSIGYYKQMRLLIKDMSYTDDIYYMVVCILLDFVLYFVEIFIVRIKSDFPEISH